MPDLAPKVPLVLLPTPLHRLHHVSDDLGCEVYIKRDDLTGFAMGGNKGRKLEFLIADALRQGSTAVVSCGGLQSNFIRQLGAACACYGLRCAAATMRMPYEEEPAEESLDPQNGNVILDHLLGVDLRVYPDGEWETLYAHAETLALEYESRGETVYRVPIGGSSPLGALGFYQAGEELRAQSEPFDHILFASSSGSTHTGLAHALRDLPTRLLGIACDPEPEIAHDFAKISEGLAPVLGQSPLPAEAFELNFDYVGPGYGVPSEDGMEAIRYLARREGIFLDPVYSGKAFAGLLDLARRLQIKGRILFWHTGGMPALFALGLDQV